MNEIDDLIRCSRQRRYNENTIKVYAAALKSFKEYIAPVPLTEVTNQELESVRLVYRS